MLQYGISARPDESWDDLGFLESIAAKGDAAFELAFVNGFPWKERRCAEFGDRAATLGVQVSVHAPYFAVLTVQDEQKAIQCRAAIEHSVKLGAELGATTIVAHLGATHDEDPEALLGRIRRHLDWIGSKVGHLGVTVGLETAGNMSSFGSLGDIAVLAREYPFVRPVVDWAHVHAMSRGGLTTVEAFEAVFGFLRAEFDGWKVDPLHTQFSDNEFGDRGELRHTAYGGGTLRVAPLIGAAQRMGVRLTVISESRDDASHDVIRAEATAAIQPPSSGERRAASADIAFPARLEVVADAGRFATTRSFRDLSLSNLDKVFFPDVGYTKGDLIEYYNAIAPILTPHLEDRAIVMARFPDGAAGDFFYEKQAPGHQPDWMPLAPIHSTHRGEDIEFVTAADAASLTWLASMGCIEIHPWLSRMPTLECPDFAIFDLDPADGASWEQVVDVAGLVRVLLDQVGLTGYPKLSGASGIHIYVPLDPLYSYGRVRRFVEAVGELLVAANPDDVTMEWDIPKRRGKVFVDHNQNVGGKTIASVYSVRPTPVASVSAPIAWSELDDVRPEDFTISTIWRRLDAVGDLFAPVLRGGQRLEQAERLVGIEP